MRFAVALPSLEAAAPERRALEAMLTAIVDAGHSVEGFVEHDRTEEVGPVPMFHYLRIAERHAAEPFETALYPLGRDASPYQSVFAMMHRFPGVIWFFDAVMHHLAVGGIGLMDDWVGYRDVLDQAYGDTGAAVTQTVASNWGTGALFRRYDLIAQAAAVQHTVLAVWPALAEKAASRLVDTAVATVPLGLVDLGTATAPLDTVNKVAIMTVNESYSTTAVRAAEAILALDRGLSVRVCLSEPIYKAEAVEVARHRGIGDKIDWQLTTDPDVLAAVAADSDVLVWLAEELQSGHRLLLLQGMAAGKPTVVPRCPLYGDLPSGAVAKLDLGHTLGASCAALLEALIDDAELRAALCRHARAFAQDAADVAQAADALVGALERSAKANAFAERDVSASTWAVVEDEMVAAVTPAGVSAEAGRHLRAIVRRHTETFYR